jgi:hypothetical protein
VNDRVPGVVDCTPLPPEAGAECFRGNDARTGKAVTLKIFSSVQDDDQFSRFSDVARSVRSLGTHPNIAPLIDAGITADRHPYVVVDHTPRRLADLITEQGTLRWQEAVALGTELSGALSASHRAGVVHGDVSPRSVLLADQDIPLLSDFGVRTNSSDLDLPNDVAIQRLAHASPEVVQGREPDERSDVYSLASTLYEALTGAPPFVRAGDTLVGAVASRVLTDSPPSLQRSGVPAELEGAIVGALAKDPAHRPASADLFAQELLAAARRSADSTESASRSPRLVLGGVGASGVDAATEAAPRGPRRNPLLEIGVAAVAVVAVVAIVFVSTHGKKKSSAAATTAPAAATGATVAPSSVLTTSAPTLAGGTGPLSAESGPTATDNTTGTTELTIPNTDAAPTTAAGPPPTVVWTATTPGTLLTSPIPLEGSGYHITSFASSVEGTTITIPADGKFHYVAYSVAVAGGQKASWCPVHSTPVRVEGLGLSNLNFGGCFPSTSTNQIRIRAWKKTKVTVNLWMCDNTVVTVGCPTARKSTNKVELTIVTV